MRTQQATRGYCNCTTQTNQFTHNEKNTGTYARKKILFHVSVTCQSKQMSCSLSHTPTVLWLYSCFCPYSKWAIPVRRPHSAAQSPWKCVSGEIPRCQKSCQWERIHWSLPLSDLFCATPPLCTPKKSHTFPQLKDYLVSLHFTLWGSLADINSSQKNCGSWLIPHPHGLNVSVLRMGYLN